MPRQHNHYYCCVATCRNSSITRPDLAYFGLPVEPERRMRWLELIGRKDTFEEVNLKHYSVCEDHFHVGCIRRKSRPKALNPLALPTVGLPMQEELIEKQCWSVVSRSTSTHTMEPDISDTNQDSQNSPETDKDTNKRLTFKELTFSLKTSKLNSIEELEMLSKFYGRNEFTDLIKCSENLSTTRMSVKTYESYRQYCVNLNYGSPLGYRLLKSVINLPNISTLYKQMSITTQTNTRLMNSLQLKVGYMSLEERQCMIVIDSMPLTPSLSYDDKTDQIIGFHDIDGIQLPFVAEKALVMMIHGMFKKWQQPAAFALLSQSAASDGKLAQWINHVINKLCEMKLIIRVLSFVSKTEANFFENRWVSIGAPYFFIKKRKIFYISDPVMLLNKLRNDLRLSDIYYKNGIAKYEHIINFYNKDKNTKYRLAPNLTDAHIYPNKCDEKDAVELFSNSVASGLSTYVDCKQIDESARGTAILIHKISNLISFFNSSNDINSNKRALSGDESHKRYLNEMRILFQNMRLIDSNNAKDEENTHKLVQGFLINITTYLRLSEELKLENNDHLPKRILNQGLTDEFFENIRLKSNAGKPTAAEFVTAYKQLYIMNAIKPIRNCYTQAKKKFFIFAKKSILRQNTYELSKYLHELKHIHHLSDGTVLDNDKITISESEYNHIDRSDRHTLMYVSGYLLKKCKEYHRCCALFMKYAEGTNENVTLNHITRYLQYSQKNLICLLAIPCNHFVNIIEKLEEVFRKQFRKNCITCKVEQTLFHSMMMLLNNIGDPPCPCFPLAYLVKLFIRLRIAYTIKLNNTENVRKQHFIIPLLVSETYTQFLS